VLLSPAGPLAWASGRAGLAGPSPAIWAELDPAPKKLCWAGPGPVQSSQKNKKQKNKK